MKRQILKTLLIIFLSVFSLLIIFTILLINRPAMFITEQTLPWIVNYFIPEGNVTSWGSAKIKSTFLGFGHNRIEFTFTDLCLEMSEDENRFCFDNALLTFTYALEGFKLKIKEVGPVRMTGGNAVIHMPGSPGKRDKSPELKIPDLVRPGLLRDSKIMGIEVVIDHFQAFTGAAEYNGSLALHGNPNASKIFDRLQIKGDIRDREGKLDANLKAVIHSPTAFLRNDWKITAQGGILLAGNRRITLLTTLNPQPNRYDYTLTGDYVQDQFRLETNGAGSFREDNIRGVFSGAIHNAHPNLSYARFNGCGLNLNRTDAARNIGQMHLHCPVSFIGTSLPRLPEHLARLLAPPERIDVIVDSDLSTFFFPDPKKGFYGQVNAEILPFRTGIMTGNGRVQAQVTGIWAEPPRTWSAVVESDVALTIPRFQSVVEQLAGTRWDVWAPGRVLDGTVTLGIQGMINLRTDTGHIPITFKTELSSPDQKFFAEGEGEAFLQLGGGSALRQLEGDIILSDVQIVLPNFEIGPLPRFTPDSRITTAESRRARASKTPLEYHLKIATLPDNPLRLLTNRAEGPVPVNLNLDLKPGVVDGFIDLGGMEIDFYRRNINLNRFRIELEDPLEESSIDGLASIQYFDYIITVGLFGTMQKPRLIFNSSPYLTEEQIMSVLIYGEPHDELDSNEASNMGQLSAALAARAVTVGSLFALANSPIQNINFNPETGVFEARIRVGDKTSLTLGTDWKNSPHVGLRRKIGKNWFMTTTVNDPGEETDVGASAFLEWVKRY